MAARERAGHEGRRVINRIALAGGGHDIVYLRRVEQPGGAGHVFRAVMSGDAPGARPRVIPGNTAVVASMTPDGQGGTPANAVVEAENLDRPHGVIKHKRFTVAMVDGVEQPPTCSDFYSVWIDPPPDERELLDPTNEHHLHRVLAADDPEGLPWFRCLNRAQAVRSAQARCEFFNEAHGIRAGEGPRAYVKRNNNGPYVLVTVGRGGFPDAKARFYYEEPPERNMLDYVLRTMQPQRQETQAKAFKVSRTGQEALDASRRHKRTPVFWNTTVERLMAFCTGRVSEVREDEAVWRPPPNV